MKDLVIVFVKNPVLGKVKTRLASAIGDREAFAVYKHLIAITERETTQLKCDVHVYFSDEISSYLWPDCDKYVQQGSDLGERMNQAFQQAFDQGYTKVVGIGSDLPDIRKELIDEAFASLDSKETVFGPATDGGYYLLGMKRMIPLIFEDKEWSTDTLFANTITELNEQKVSSHLLEELNDIDTIKDLERSSIANEFAYLLTNNRSC